MEAAPLCIQKDRTLLLDTRHPDSSEIRNHLLQFAEIVKCPRWIQIFKITRLTLWNAVANGWTEQAIADCLERYSHSSIDSAVLHWIHEEMQKYGCLILEKTDQPDTLSLRGDPKVLEVMRCVPAIRERTQFTHPDALLFLNKERGTIKRACISAGYPVVDKAGYTDGQACKMDWNPKNPVSLRSYQLQALEHYFTGDDAGSGVLVLPCGAGKTLVGIAAMIRLQMNTIILTPNTVSATQWQQELLRRTTLTEREVGLYTANSKRVAPITITTYQMLVKKRDDTLIHFERLSRQPWGLVIYDEVHLLPAPVFRLSADLQSRRRLGLTATLIREDGAEEEVFVLVGPKKYDIPWRVLEQGGWIAPTRCVEVPVPFPAEDKHAYLRAGKRQQYRMAAENPQKMDVLALLMKRHEHDRVLIIGQYLDQLTHAAKRLGAPLITGKTPNPEREILYERFRRGDIRSLIVSKVANVAVDLPDANVAIQISGTFGSRQEEAQRLGRILRPNHNGGESIFYTLVTKSSVEQEYSWNRQLFLTEQGYRYEWLELDTLSEVEKR
jgi:DNA excision repair protein ERCC-3